MTPKRVREEEEVGQQRSLNSRKDNQGDMGSQKEIRDSVGFAALRQGHVSTSDHLPKASRKFNKPWRLETLRCEGGVNQQTSLGTPTR